ncbi:MAG: DUF1122 family protein [Candidatus Hydrothermarchaeales archaeon]
MGASGDRNKLTAIEGSEIGGFTIRISEPVPTRLRGAWRFNLRLKDEKGKTSAPIIEGRYFEGRGKWIRPWLEVEYRSTADFDGFDVELSMGSEIRLFEALSSILPPGGHIMVKYGEHRDTARALAINVPPPATPLGYLLWQAGFRWFKDWYFPEGWMEGSEKLQGNKPLDEEHAKKRAKEASIELKAFLKGKFNWDDELLARCRKLAGEILNFTE